MGEVVSFNRGMDRPDLRAEKAWETYQVLRRDADAKGTKEAHFKAGKALGDFYRIVSGMSK